MLVSFIKQGSLTSSQIVQISVHTTSLHNVLEVKICLAVAYEVNFFTDQFLHYFGPATGRPAKIGKLLIQRLII